MWLYALFLQNMGFKSFYQHRLGGSAASSGKNCELVSAVLPLGGFKCINLI